ncbi:hypothetical protein C8R45DRAFT_1099278 [Mycena sanguinolenta]|nr:hypothetical protein C8R45DRAFT_1099278 [Mycena sanguinolenta]
MLLLGRLWNGLLRASGKYGVTFVLQHHASSPSLVQLPRLKDVSSGEKFGLVASAGVDFDAPGLFTIKPEPDFVGEGDAVEELDPPEKEKLMQELNIDPALFLQPMVLSQATVPMDIEFIRGSSMSAAGYEHVDVQTSSALVPAISSTGESSRKRKEHHELADSVINEEMPQSKRIKIDSGPVLYSIFTTSSSGTATPSTTSSRPTAIPSAEFDAQVEPPPHPAPSKLTPSQQFFAILTHTDPRAFKINQGAEFFLFMDLRAEL